MNDGLEKARERQQILRETGQLVVCTNPAQKVAKKIADEGKITARQAIQAKCWECMGGTADDWDAGIRQDIKNCSCGPESICPCPLWDFRPYQGRK